MYAHSAPAFASSLTLSPPPPQQQQSRGALVKLSNFLDQFLVDVEELCNYNLSAAYPLSETVFGSEYEGLYERQFLHRALSSHLQTHCRTIVLGTDVHAINVMLRSLAIFATPAQRKCSRLAHKEFNALIPDAYLQGILLTVRPPRRPRPRG